MSKDLQIHALREIAGLAYLIYEARNLDPNDPGYCLFIGSGCSLPAAPSSSELVGELVEEMYPKSAPSELKTQFEKEFSDYFVGVTNISLEAVAEAYKQKKGAEALSRSLKAKFGKISNSNKGYEALGELVKEGYFKLIFTTNIDTLIEDSFSRIGLEFDLFNDLSDYYRRPALPRPRVYKLHGSYDKIDPNIAWRDVEQLHPRKELHLRHFFESNHFIFVGYSAQDFDIYSSLIRVDNAIRERLRIYSFTLHGKSQLMILLLRRFFSSKGNISMGNVKDGGTFFLTLKDEIKTIEEKKKDAS